MRKGGDHLRPLQTEPVRRTWAAHGLELELAAGGGYWDGGVVTGPLELELEGGTGRRGGGEL